MNKNVGRKKLGLLFLTLIAAEALLADIGSLRAEDVSVTNHSFEAGASSPDGWTLTEGSGNWLSGNAADGNRCISVIGSTLTVNTWESETIPFISSAVYRLTFKARGDTTSNDGGLIAGASLAIDKIQPTSDAWVPYIYVFTAPGNVGSNTLCFGQKNYPGTASFDDIHLERVLPGFTTVGDLLLGEGETISGNTYTFVAPFANGNYSRPLAGHQTLFHTREWCFYNNQYYMVAYRHTIGSRSQTAATVTVHVGYYSIGTLVVEASADGTSYTTLGTITAAGAATFTIPPALLPATAVWVRLRAAGSPITLEVDQYSYRATVNGAPHNATGSTHFYNLSFTDPRVTVTINRTGEGLPGADNVFVARVTNNSAGGISVAPSLTTQSSKGQNMIFHSSVTVLQPGDNVITIPYELYASGDYGATFSLGSGIAGQATTVFMVPTSYEGDFGVLLSTQGPAAVWWASSGWKILKTHPVPLTPGASISITVARSEAEAAQLVINPHQALTNFIAQSRDLSGSDGAILPASTIEVLRERYVPVAIPTDSYGFVGDWPDPLPPFNGGISVAAGQNQPLWIRVTIPTSTISGLYQGAVHLQADGYSAEIPLEVTVYGFTLPDETTCATSFDLYDSSIWQYQKITDIQQKREVLEKYWKMYASHRIAPDNPAPLDNFTCTMPSSNLPWTGPVGITTETAHGGSYSLKVNDHVWNAGIRALYNNWIPITSASRMTLSFWYKTALAGQQVTARLLYRDVSGSDVTIPLSGNGAWQQYSQTFTGFPAGVTGMRPEFYGAEYTSDGSNEGITWYDDVSIRNDTTAEECMSNGGFETVHDPSAMAVTFNWDAWDHEMSRVLTTWPFKSFVFYPMGLGDGWNGNGREYEPVILGYTETLPQYKTLFTQWYSEAEQHLRAQGWLNKSFIYWYEEPEPEDYTYVINGFSKIKAAAPGFRRFLAEQVEPQLVGTPNIWCPLSSFYEEAPARARQQAGDEVWWYVCCVPKTPYCSLHIDHPSIDLRTWLWQTWQRGVTGVLIWATNYWNCTSAYTDPATPQNPYLDPMSYGESASTYYGNGDGRLIYPPEAAADGRQPSAVLDGPVASIRLEMLRDGLEDYEYFSMLKKLLDNHEISLTEEERRDFTNLLTVPAAVTSDIVTYSQDPAALESHRRKLGRAIEYMVAVTTPLVISEGPMYVTLYPRTITPNGDGRNDRLFFNYPRNVATDALTYKVYDMSGIMVREDMLRGSPRERMLKNGSYLNWWDGRDLSGNFVRPGPYLVVIFRNDGIFKKEFIAIAR